ncbi:hypothetical protein VTK26DRAFT_4889 [Humicola hyalothermophila]
MPCWCSDALEFNTINVEGRRASSRRQDFEPPMKRIAAMPTSTCVWNRLSSRSLRSLENRAISRVTGEAVSHLAKRDGARRNVSIGEVGTSKIQNGASTRTCRLPPAAVESRERASVILASTVPVDGALPEMRAECALSLHFHFEVQVQAVRLIWLGEHTRIPSSTVHRCQVLARAVCSATPKHASRRAFTIQAPRTDP